MALTLVQGKQQTWQARYTSLTWLQDLSFKFKCACVVWSLFVFTNHNPTIVLQKFLFGYFVKVVVALQCWAWKDKIRPTFVKISLISMELLHKLEPKGGTNCCKDTLFSHLAPF
jgi:hypothetical protein